MDAPTRELVTWTIGTLIGLSVLIGLAVKYLLMPYLRDHLIVPMRQVEKQVSENSHSNREPTVLDRIDDVQDTVNRIATGLEKANERFDRHLGWSHEEANRLWHAILTRTRHRGPNKEEEEGT